MGVSRQRATWAGGIYDVLHAVNKMYDSGNDDDGDGDDAAREGERAGGRDAGSRRRTRAKTEEFH